MVDEYFKDLEVTLTKINMHESEESNIARFVNWLRPEIQNVVALRVESQVLTKKSFQNTHNDAFYKSSWNDKNQFQNQDFPSIFSKESTSQHQPSKDNPFPYSLKAPTKTSNKKCFKCLGFRV